MNLVKKYLASTSLALSICFPTVQLRTILHDFDIPKAFLVSSQFSFDCFQKYSYMDQFKCNLSSNDVNVTPADSNEDMNNELQQCNIMGILKKSVKNSSAAFVKDDFITSMKKKIISTSKEYKHIRKWTTVNQENAKKTSNNTFVLKLLSFNILAQNLLETHSYLYRKHDKKTLLWKKRKRLLLQEILESNAHVICLQEVQQEHLADILIPFQNSGFTYLYKKRTNDKKDGLLLLYKTDLFNLLEFSKVELYQNGVELLNRDNVGLVAKFSLIESPETKFVVATTHLLFNPRRNDVRLSQVQVLFSEIERIAFIENTLTGPSYLPIVLSGDFNLEPFSGVYKFIIEGSIEFMGKSKSLEKRDSRCLSNCLIPPHLYVTDECQHFNVLSQRLSGKGSGKVMLENAENPYLPKKDKLLNELEGNIPFNTKSNAYQKVEVVDGHYVTFSSGLLTHPFRFHSIYNHKVEKGKNEATTFQNRWITVDYIFYSGLKPLERYRLPTTDECTKFLSTIPNSIVGSDHLCLGASFLLEKNEHLSELLDF